jgi:tight adherence protein B
LTGEVSGVAIALAALAGGMCALAAREAVLATPAVARWVTTSVEPLLRAGREGYEPSEAERRRLAAVGAMTLAAAALLVAGPMPAAIVAVAGPASAASVLGRRRARYRRAVESGVPDIAGAIADALSGGRSVRGALGAASSSLDGPAAVELSRVRADLELGASTSEALTAFQGRMRSGRIDSLVAALVSQQLGGGNLAALLRRHAAAAADSDRVAADARAATAQARFTGMLVVAMPTGAALFAELLEPGFMGRILADPAAAILLVLAAGLQIGGFAAIRRLSRIGE